MSWLLGLIVYPILEEYVFRASFLEWLDIKLPKSRGWRTNVLVSIVFAAAHLWAWPVLHCVAVFFPSLFFGWLWQRNQKLWVCASAHALLNASGMALNHVFKGWQFWL